MQRSGFSGASGTRCGGMTWFHIVSFTIIGAMATTIVALSLTKPQCDADKHFDFMYLNGMTNHYNTRLDYLRENDMDFLGNAVYLDSAGATLYTTSQIRRQMNVYRHDANNSDRDSLEDKVRDHLLNFFGAGNDYGVIFVPSTTYGLKLIGESFRFSNDSVYHFMRWSHSSALRIRAFAQKSRVFDYSSIPEAEAGEIAINPPTLKKTDVVDLIEVPLEENFAGRSLDKSRMIGLINKAQSGLFSTRKAIVIADAAAYAPTNKLNLTETPFHAVAVSFHKMFGTPNYGALIVHQALLPHLKRRYRSSVSAHFILSNSTGSSRDTTRGGGFEDYLVPEATLVGINSGLELLETLGMANINAHVRKLRTKLVESLSKLEHDGGEPMITIYGANGDTENSHIVTFNVKFRNGSFVGYKTVVDAAAAKNIQLRGGCLCNPGACYEALGLTEAQVVQYFGQKTKCDCQHDIDNQKPLGAVRASVGWMTSDKEVRRLIGFLRRHFRNK